MIPPMLHVHISLIYHLCYTLLAAENIVKYTIPHPYPNYLWYFLVRKILMFTALCLRLCDPTRDIR
jgi:hypothetical protein